MFPGRATQSPSRLLHCVARRLPAPLVLHKINPLRALILAAGLATAVAALRLVRRLCTLQVQTEARRPGTAICADELGTRISLEEIYQDGLKTACHRDVSASEVALLESDGGCSAYGDSDLDLVVRVFEEVLGRRLAPADCFYDLGSGDGRLVVSMALFTPCGRSVGIELCASRHEHALAAQAAACGRGLLAADASFKALSSTGVGGGAGGGGVELCCQSMLEHDLIGASLVFSFNLPEPGGVFLYAMKAHLLRTLAHGACVLLRGQVLPAAAATATGAGQTGTGQIRCAADLAAYYRDRSSWGVALGTEPLPAGGCAADTVRASFRRLEPVLQTDVVNRMFNCVAYSMVEKQVVLPMGGGACGRGGGGGDGEGGDSRGEQPLPVLVDSVTQAAYETDARVRRAVQGWIDAECAALEASRGDGWEPRTLLLRERREPLGDSRFERSVYDDEPGDDGELVLVPCIWETSEHLRALR